VGGGSMTCSWIALAVVGVLLGGAVILVWRGVMTAKWWALPVLGVGLVLTFIVPAVVYPLTPRLDLALWLPDELGYWGMYLAASWVVAFVVIVALKGFAFGSPTWHGVSLVVFLSAMLASSLGGCWVSAMGQDRMPFTVPGESAVSPDGRWRAYGLHFFWTVFDVSLWYEHNRWFDAQGRESGCVDLSHMGDHLSPTWRVVWSRDSEIASIWNGDLVLLACDVGKEDTWCVPLGHDEADRLTDEELRAKMTGFTEQMQSLLNEHGGPAP